LRANRVIEKKLPADAVADYDPELDDYLISEIDRSLAGENQFLTVELEKQLKQLNQQHLMKQIENKKPNI
jgi:hypothetical protein